MKKTEFAVGEIVQFGLKKLKVVRSVFCCNCYLFENKIYMCRPLVGSCRKRERTDKLDVIFIEVAEEQE